MTIKEFKIQYALGSLSEDYIFKLAKSKNTPKEILTILSTDKDINVRYRVASNSNTPKETLKKLSTDKDSDVRYWVANNPNTPIVNILKKLSTDVRIKFYSGKKMGGMYSITKGSLYTMVVDRLTKR